MTNTGPVENPVLLTGGAGYIGSHVVLALLEADHPVVVLDNLAIGHREAVPDAAAFVEGDAGDADTVRGVIADYRIGAVLHLAGSTGVSESLADPLRYYQNNAHASTRLVRACIDGGVERFVFSSSAAVYGSPGPAPVTEDAPTAPISPYGRSKLVTEWMLRDAAAAHDFRYIALRYFNVAGADPDGRAGPSSHQAGHLIGVACEAALGLRDHVTVFGTDYDTPDGTCIRDYIHVSDLARAHVTALHRLERDPGSLVLNCGYGRGASVRQVLDTMRAVHGRPLRVHDGPRRAGDPPALVAGTSRIRDALEWSPRHRRLQDIIRTALSWETRRPGRHAGQAPHRAAPMP